MDDTMKEVLSQMKAVFDLMASDEFVEAVATFNWKLFSKLRQKGFTDEQALSIVSKFSNQTK